MSKMIMIVFLALLFQNCGISKSDYEKLQKDYESAKTNYEKLQKDYELVKRDYEKLKDELKEYQETPSALIARAESEKNSKHYDEAISLLNKVLSKAPETPFAKKANEIIKNIEIMKVEDSVASLIAAGDEMFEKSQFDKAIAEYKKVVESYPKSKYEIIANTRIAKVEKEKTNAWIDLGKGLSYRKVGFRNQMGMFTEVYGELKNSSGTDMSVAMLTVSVYDADDNLLGNGPIPVNNFPNNKITNFTGMIEVPTNKISRFKIQFDTGM